MILPLTAALFATTRRNGLVASTQNCGETTDVLGLMLSELVSGALLRNSVSLPETTLLPLSVQAA